MLVRVSHGLTNFWRVESHTCTNLNSYNRHNKTISHVKRERLHGGMDVKVKCGGNLASLLGY